MKKQFDDQSIRFFNLLEAYYKTAFKETEIREDIVEEFKNYRRDLFYSEEVEIQRNLINHTTKSLYSALIEHVKDPSSKSEWVEVLQDPVKLVKIIKDLTSASHNAMKNQKEFTKQRQTEEAAHEKFQNETVKPHKDLTYENFVSDSLKEYMESFVEDFYLDRSLYKHLIEDEPHLLNDERLYDENGIRKKIYYCGDKEKATNDFSEEIQETTNAMITNYGKFAYEKFNIVVNDNESK